MKIDVDKVDTILNKESWLLWVSGASSDMRDIIQLSNDWDEKSKLSLSMYIDRIVKYISYYIASMNWVDHMIFTWWIWENSPIIRKMIIEKLKYFNIKLRWKNKELIWEEWMISDKKSWIAVWVIPTNEELEIAIETFNIIKKNAT